MSEKYKIYNQDYPYFITSTIVDWIDLFTRREYFQVIIDSLNYCRNNKGLQLYAYCIMTNHIHLVIGSEKENLEGIIRDFKSYTSHELRKELENHPQKSRKDWILDKMYAAGRSRKSNNDFQLWRHNYHPIHWILMN